mgnify:CR=1 FL=1
METAPPSSITIERAVREFVATARSMPLDNISLNQSLFHDLGIDGDDAFDLIKKFSVRFNVSLDDFNFQKYFGCEAASGPIALLVELFTKENSRKLRRLEVADLVRAASDGRFL